MSTALNISGPTKETIQEVRDFVMAILTTQQAEEETKRTALETIPKLINGNVSVSGCHFQGPF